jgi:hypothetical protein
MSVHLFNSNEPRYAQFVSSNLTHYYMVMYKTYPHSIITNLCYLDVHVTVHRDQFLIIKPTRCTNFSNLLLE